MNPIKADWSVFQPKPLKHDRKGRGRRASAPSPNPKTAGKVSWKCSHEDHNGCTKLDCPCKCHQEIHS